MGKNVAVDGCELEDVTGGGTVTITGTASTAVLAGGKGIFFGDVAVSVSGSNGDGSITDNNGAGTGTIRGSGENICENGENICENGQPALLEGDTATVKVSGTSTSGSTVTPVGPIEITIKVKKAGQTDVIAL